MKLSELKRKVNGQAETIIAQGLGLKHKGAKYSCPHGENHKKEQQGILETEWKQDHFFCFNCHKGYDIIDYARANETDWIDWLHNLAGEKRKQFKRLKPISKRTEQTAIEYLKSRGIREETISEYHVRSDADSLIFNYATPSMELVAIKTRGIKDKRFGAVKGGTPMLFGMHLLKNQTKLVICEGEIDAMSMYEIAKLKELENDWLCVSLPNGSGSLNQELVSNVEEWLELFELIIICPDQDEAGEKFTETASELLGSYNLGLITLPVNDVNEYLLSPEYNPADITSLTTKLLPKLSLAVSSSSEGRAVEYKAYESGYWTLDSNFAGLQEGWLTILAGAKNDGKTTFTRQILLSLARQKIKSFMFIGEGKWEEDRNKLARLAYGKAGGSKLRPNTPADSKRWDATEEAINKYRSEFGDYITMADMTQIKSKSAYFELYNEMRKLVRHGVKVFVIDSLMKMVVNDKGKSKWEMQEQVVGDLKRFVDEERVHVILIAHTNAGGEKISGVEEIGNLADGIIKFRRLTREIKKPPLTIPSEIQDIVSSYATIAKARDDGGYKPLFFEFDPVCGALLNISTMPEAKEYEAKGYPTKYHHRYGEEDVPNYDKQFSSR